MSTIAYLLDQSRHWHQVYRDNVPRRVPFGQTTIVDAGDAQTAGEALVKACRARAEAHVLDPHFSNPAWQGEPVTHDHDALLAFYVEQLTR